MEGVQVKLNNAYRWKVSVCEDIPELGAVGSAAAGTEEAGGHGFTQEGVPYPQPLRDRRRRFRHG